MYRFVIRRTRIAASFLSTMLAMSLFAQQALAIDFIAPQIEHKITSEGVEQGDDHLITAKVTDDTGVDSVILHYRQRGSRDFNPVVMSSLDGSSHYEALIVGQDINSAGIEYFFEAADSSGNTIEMYGSDGEPFAIAVLQQQVAVASNNSAASSGARGASAQKGNSSQSVLPIKKNSSNKTWLWAGLGILAAAVVVGAAGGGGSDSVSTGPSDSTGDLDIATPIPVN